MRCRHSKQRSAGSRVIARGAVLDQRGSWVGRSRAWQQETDARGWECAGTGQRAWDAAGRGAVLQRAREVTRREMACGCLYGVPTPWGRMRLEAAQIEARNGQKTASDNDWRFIQRRVALRPGQQAKFTAARCKSEGAGCAAQCWARSRQKVGAGTGARWESCC
ncbi:hypothetical protein BDV95DRAFT_196273 [Massariosphaeria phaeospora]|uniref:Uncharacterized protein n=1 Tax=Massariosphaeria phaeospora TaxID=100035 RepID=A0A7C8MGT1_9PLEO|nr:hypothetical protein BDV95DRAFT_196273 [Massariosphaeria phaeospora]